jgi:5'-nucleotidase/UDP-sugar diphosphatase
VAEGKKKLPALGPSEVPWETDLGNLVADAMRERLGLPIALVNSSAIRSGLPFGPVTVADVFQAISPRTRLAALELKGSTLSEILETSVSSKCPDFLQASGLSVDVGLGRVVGLRAGGDPIVPDRWYAVATTDSAVVKSSYDEFKKGRDYQSYDLSLAQVVLEYLRERKTIGTETEIRFRVRTK